MPDVVIVLVVIVTLLGAYLLGWLRHSRRHAPARWYWLHGSGDHDRSRDDAEGHDREDPGG